MIERIAIANRGEVAVRIIRACQEMGIETVLLHSEADQNSSAARLADECVCIGEASSASSYLNIQNNINGALMAGADAVHPGFGFLSENADFAEGCAQKGLIFIGPSADSIRLFGDKISAKKLVMSAGAPVIPGYNGDDQSLDKLVIEAEKMGWPVIVKAAAGGGGRGLKIIRHKSEAREQIESAQREGQAAFGSGRVFLEKYLDRAKHIEVQIFGDAVGNIYSLGERECSVQRRHQKMIEESPSIRLPADLRVRINEAAVAIAKQAKYQNAGTIEFLVQDNQFYFMEVNTRLQVEHPVTEMIMGVDLVKAQILTAMKKPLLWTKLEPRGHSIECRIYAEDPYNFGIPSIGKVLSIRWPEGPGRRFDTGIEASDEVTSHYDSMVAKIIVWDESRPRAIAKMKRTLQDTIIFGIHTNIPLLQQILSHPEFSDGTMTTRFFESHFGEGLPQRNMSVESLKLIEIIKNQLSSSPNNTESLKNPWTHSWESP